ncbi:MAG TPA: bile acid:sodium symporter [Mycobacteriales bacterium]|nr:bile acid:sodium symporter [Mycobacteriales bacterium]
MGEHLSAALFTGGLAVAIVATVLSLGMAFPVAGLVAPLRRVRLVVAMVVLNTLVLPALAWALATAAPIAPGYVAGIALAAIGSAGAAGLKAAQLSRRADLPLAVSLVVVLQLANLVAVPVWAAVVVTGASLSRLRILQSLLVLVLLPLVAGAVVRTRSEGLAARLRPVLVRVANVALVAALVTGIAANRDLLLSVIGSWVLPVALAIAALGLGLGLLVGGGDRPMRVTTSLVSGTRFSALGLIIVGTRFPDQHEYLASAITFSLVDFVVMLGVAVGIGRRVLPRRLPR